jgi:PAB1-binding protein PBP1
MNDVCHVVTTVGTASTNEVAASVRVTLTISVANRLVTQPMPPTMGLPSKACRSASPPCTVASKQVGSMPLHSLYGCQCIL